MAIIDRLLNTLPLSTGDEQLFSYTCQSCGSEFEVPEVSTSRVECPDCGASGSRYISS